MKTYHHLAVGDNVVLEHYNWYTCEVQETTRGGVREVLKTRVTINFDMWLGVGRTFNTNQHFSRRTGERWGAEDVDYRINQQHARAKS